MIVAKVPVTVQLSELGKDQVEIVHGERAVDMTGYLRCLPAGELAEDIVAHLVNPLLKLGNFRGKIHSFREDRKFLNLLFQLHQRFFKLHIYLSSHLLFLLIFLFKRRSHSKVTALYPNKSSTSTDNPSVGAT